MLSSRSPARRAASVACSCCASKNGQPAHTRGEPVVGTRAITTFCSHSSQSCSEPPGSDFARLPSSSGFVQPQRSQVQAALIRSGRGAEPVVRAELARRPSHLLLASNAENNGPRRSGERAQAWCPGVSRRGNSLGPARTTGSGQPAASARTALVLLPPARGAGRVARLRAFSSAVHGTSCALPSFS